MNGWPQASQFPGGGSIAALCAALAAGLAEMVAHLTVGRQDDPALDREMNDLIDRAQALRNDLTRAVDRDSEAYGKVMQAYRRPKTTNEEKRLRSEAIQEALKEAARVPLTVAEMGVEILGLAGIAVNKGNRNAVTDGLAGALMARSAVLAAIANVRINLQPIIDDEVRAEGPGRYGISGEESPRCRRDDPLGSTTFSDRRPDSVRCSSSSSSF